MLTTTVVAVKNVLRQMNAEGDTVLAEFDPADAKAVADAKAMFDALLKDRSMGAATRRADGQLQQVWVFDPSLTEVLFHPHQVGG